MMPSRSSIVRTIVVCVCPLFWHQPLVAQAPPLNPQFLDSAIESARQSWQVPGVAVAVVKDDQVIYIKGFGVRELGQDAPVTPDTLFAIASCTKAFAATSVAILVNDGVMAWDDPVRKHLHYFRLSDAPADSLVTLRDLMCHRTGLSRHDLLGFSAGWGQDETVRRIGLVKLNKPFRSNWEYNNIMFQATGLSVAAASKMEWDEFVRQRILVPLGMTRTTARNTVAMQDDNHARPHVRPHGGATEVVPWRPYENSAAGSMLSSANEMSKWVRFQLGDGTLAGKRIMAKAHLDETHTPQMVVGFSRATYPETNQVTYGLGWFIHDHRGHHMISHTGGLEGFRCRVVLVPKQKLGVIVLSNSGVGESAASMHYVVSNTLLDHLLGLPVKDWNEHYTKAYESMAAAQERQRQIRQQRRQADTTTSRPLNFYAGTFANPAYGNAKVNLAKDTLQLEWGIFRFKLDHFHFDTFRGIRQDVKARPGNEQTISFQLDANGDVMMLRMFGHEFTRVGRPPARS